MTLKAEIQAYYEEHWREGVHPKLGPYAYTAPSERHPYQWLWDSAFHAVVRAHWDPDRALRELETLFRIQNDDGFVPHMVYWPPPPVIRWVPEAERVPGGSPERLVPVTWHSPVPPYAAFEADPRRSDAHSTLIQPPVFGTVFLRLWELLGPSQRLKNLWPRALAFYQWLREHRDPDGDLLVSILQSRESGLDYSPAYDAVWQHAARKTGFLAQAPPTPDTLARISDRVFVEHNADRWNLRRIFRRRVFDVEDLTVNVLMARGLWDLARLGEHLGLPGAREARHWAEQQEQAILNRLWHPEDNAFFSLHHPGGRKEVPLRVRTVASLLPLGLPHLREPQERALIQSLHTEFHTPFPVPSVATTEPTFDPGVRPPRLIWRGPVWMNMNWLLARFLKERGYQEDARRIARASLELVQKSGFREYFHPFTGEGGGAFRFGWTGLVLDLLEI